MYKYKGFLIVLILLTVNLITGPAVGEEFREGQIKVAYLYNFAKFVDWPPEAFKSDSAPIIIGILGVDPFGSLLDSLKDKNVRGRKFQIKRAVKPENMEECHILFFGASEKANLRGLLSMIKNNHILTVSDLDRFAHLGGMIGLTQVEEKINFEINIDVVQRSRLKFNAQLLKLARIVHSGS
jgi:hypothetical protein